MNEIRLNILDSLCAITGTIHACFAEAAVAALSAEPETIRELEDAVARFIKPGPDSRLFSSFEKGTDCEPCDEGIVFINLAAKIVAAQSSYSCLAPKGTIRYHNGAQSTAMQLPYQVTDDWLFVHSLVEYNAVRDIRLAYCASIQPLDARAVLYGSVLDFVVRECLLARNLLKEDPIAEIHAKWLMTPRDDLRGQSPREVLLMKRDFIDADLHSREMQWSLLHEPPPGLHPDSSAYRFAGFGSHEFILYYDLMRMLLSECWKHVGREGPLSVPQEVSHLERIKTEWLKETDPECTTRTIAFILESERRRIPLLITPEEVDFEDDCPLCQTMGHDHAPAFCHFDGSNMDDDYPFSFCHTRDEWEEERRCREEFHAEFERQWNDRDKEFPGDSSQPAIH